MKKPTLCIIIPCYNEEKVLPITCEMFLDKITELIQNDKSFPVISIGRRKTVPKEQLKVWINSNCKR